MKDLNYHPIDEYGIIGNMRSAALVGMNGSIDWFCFPHFDSPSIFAKILDHRIGGYFSICPTPGFKTKQFYWPDTNVLITRFLDRSLPYRSLFMRSSLVRYRDHLLDAMAGLMVQLHLNGVYWGDCSLSNTLFRRDAGTLQAYLVDAETSEVYSGYVSPTLRFHDL